MSEEVNPRGIRRPHDGRGMGVGVNDGRRMGRNTEPCEEGGVGFAEGKGKGRGKNRT